MKISDVVHRKIAGGKNLFCAWPWTGGIHNFGSGEIVIAYTEIDCAYRNFYDIMHAEAEARLVLCRTLDGGESWPEGMRQVLRDNKIPFDQWIKEGGKPQYVDMTGRDAVCIFWRSFSRDPWLTSEGKKAYRPVTFLMRSTDRGYHWHKPAIIVSHYHMDSIYGGTSYLKMPDGNLLAAFGGYGQRFGSGKKADEKALAKAERAIGDEIERTRGRSVLYISKDQGLNWYYYSTIAYEDEDDRHYPSLVLLPSGRILCSIGYRGGSSWTAITYSDDRGRTWSDPKRINDLGDNGYLCRLSDGRIVCIYGYRYVPYGIRGVVSEDDGKTWSDEFIIRDDGGGDDLGYPVVTELPDGRLMTVYYFNVVEDDLDTKMLVGGRRFIASSTFRLTTSG